MSTAEMTSPQAQQSQTQTQTVIPRKAIYKTRGSTSDVIEKKELISYPATALSQNLTIGENDTNKKIQFLLSGDCFVDGLNSYITVGIKTNKYTAYLSSDISSIVKRLVISLPSNSNQILEDVQNYNQLQSMLHVINGSEQSFEHNWNSGLNSLSSFNKSNGAPTARRFLNVHEEGEFRTMTFQLNLSGVLSSDNYLPLMLLNGLKIEIYLASSAEALHYDPANEKDWDTVFKSVDAPFGKKYDTMTAEEKTALHEGLSAHGERPDPPLQNEALTYTISQPCFNAMTVWCSNAYTQSLVKASETQQGVLLNYDTWRYNNIVPDSQYCNFAFPDSLQHIKTAYMGTHRRTRESSQHFNYVCNALKSFTFRIGSRIYNQVSNEPALAMTNLLLGVGKLGLYSQNALGYSAYPRSKNIHVFDFQTCREESLKANSGINSTNGRHLRLELNWRAGESAVIKSPTDNSVLTTLNNHVDYKEAHLDVWLEHSKFLRINSAGILVIE